MTLSVDLFFSFRSPYSYLALPRTHEVGRRLRSRRSICGRSIRSRCGCPASSSSANPQFARYVVLDASRVAEHENIPFRFPRPDPIVQDMTTLDVAEHQPYIHRLTRLGAAAQLEGRSLAFTDAISRVLWDGSVKGWNEGDHLAQRRDRGRLRSRRDGCRRSVADPDRYERMIAGERAGPRRVRPLGRADLRVRERAVLRPGPHRSADLADGRQGSETPLV